MITAKKTNVVKNEDGTGFNVTVEFFKDSVPYKTITVPNLIPADSIDTYIPGKIAVFEAIESTNIESVKGDFVPKVPSQSEKDRDTYFADIKKLDIWVSKNDKGIFAGTVQDISDLKQKIIAEHKSEYDVIT